MSDITFNFIIGRGRKIVKVAEYFRNYVSAMWTMVLPSMEKREIYCEQFI